MLYDGNNINNKYTTKQSAYQRWETLWHRIRKWDTHTHTHSCQLCYTCNAWQSLSGFPQDQVQDALQQRQVDCTNGTSGTASQMNSFLNISWRHAAVAQKAEVKEEQLQQDKEGGTGHASCYWCYQGSFFNYYMQVSSALPHCAHVSVGSPPTNINNKRSYSVTRHFPLNRSSGSATVCWKHL